MVSPRVWLITGTSSGFGRRLVSIVLARGDRVIATAKTLTRISHFLEDPGVEKSNIHCAELDISIGTKQVQERIDTIIEASGWGSVDVLVNNAGLSTPAFLEEGGAELMRIQYQTNVFGTLDVTTAVLPYMRKQRSGTVVIMGSRSGWRPEVKGLAFYASSKAAIRGKVHKHLCENEALMPLWAIVIAENMAVELEPFGIRVLIVEPGSFRTEGIYRQYFNESPRNQIPDYDDERESAEQAYRTPAGKQQGDPTKAMKVLVEVICGEGQWEDKPWPSYLILGKDAERDIKNKCTQVIRHVDEWSQMIGDLNLE